MLSNQLERPLLFLLLSLLLLFVLTPFFETTILIDFVASAILCFGVYAVSANRTVLLICVVLVVLAITALWMEHWIPDRRLPISGSLLHIAFFAVVLVQILRQVFGEGEVDGETIAGAICIYLLIGVLWADLYSVLEAVRPGSFSGALADVGGAEAPLSRVQRTEFTYYSFVTLSTLGYGEIVPTTPQARALASLEAVAGQLYLAVIVARLVAMYTRDADRRRDGMK